jgi:ABC-type transport system involved in multi-copper enzyme maturation permease subunit
MSIFVRKEIREILPAWSLALVLAIVPIWVLWPREYLAFGLPNMPEWIVYAPFAFGVLLMSVSVFGRELSGGTFAGLLVQPVSRQRIWLVKIGTLVVALGLIIAAFYISNVVRIGSLLAPLLHATPEALAKAALQTRDAAFYEAFKVGAVFALLGFAGGLWTTLLLRQVASALCLTFLASLALMFLLDLLTHNLSGLAVRIVDWGGPLIYAGATFLWSRRMFLNAQDTQWTGGIILLPNRTASDQTERELREPVRKPFRTLLLKEFQSHHVTLIVSSGFLATHVATVAARILFGTYLLAHMNTRFMLESFPLLWLLLPALVGCMAVAEERKLGTLEGLLCLPTTRRKMFIAKFIVALALGVLLGAVVPLLIEALGNLIGLNNPSMEAGFSVSQETFQLAAGLAVGSTLLVVWSMYASSLTRNTLQALGLTALALIVTVIVVGLLARVGLSWDQWAFWRGNLIKLIGWPTMVTAIILLAYGNYQQLIVVPLIWRRNVVTLLVALLAVCSLTSLLYHRVWDVFESTEPRHGFEMFQRSAFKVAPKLDASDTRVAALLPDGRIWLRKQPFQITQRVSMGRPMQIIEMAGPERSGFVAGTDWQDVAVTGNQCFAIQADGSLWDLSAIEPGKADGVEPQRVGEDHDWKKISVGASLFTALKSNGTVWMWGTETVVSNNVARRRQIAKPIQVGNDHDWIAVCNSHLEPAAMKSDGTICKWNYVSVATASNGKDLASTITAPQPWLILSNRNPVSISIDLGMVSAVCEDGTLWFAQGLAMSTPRREGESYPPQIMKQLGNLANWVDFRYAQNFQALGIQQNGSFTGNGTVSSKYSDWIAVCPYRFAFLALAADGTLCIWGTQEQVYFGRYNPYDLLAPPKIKARLVAKLQK